MLHFACVAIVLALAAFLLGAGEVAHVCLIGAAVLFVVFLIEHLLGLAKRSDP